MTFKTAAFSSLRLREIIGEEESNGGMGFGEFEIDESPLGVKRKGKRGRGAAGKVPVFGILKRSGKVYAQFIPNAKSKTLMPVIRKKIQPGSIVYSDVLYSYNYSKLFAEKQDHINGIENFWNQAKP